MKKLFFGIFILLILSFVARYLITNIKLETIICKNQYGVCRQEIEEKLVEFKNTNYFSSKNEIEKFLNEISVDEYSIRLLIPNTIRIDYIEDSPMIAIFFTEGQYIPIDESSNKFETVKETQLPKVKVLTTEEEVDLPYVVKIVSLLEENYDIVNFELATNTLKVKMRNGLEIIFPVSGDVDLLLGTFEIVLSQLNSDSLEIKIEGNEMVRATSLDLRFNNPVIK